MKKKLRAVSLFSNCGAGDIGYREAGFEFEVMAELVKHRLDVCLLNHPTAKGVQGDLRETWPDVIRHYRSRAGKARPALLCACPPCQGMSSARSGRGSHLDPDAGSKDERNLLVTVIVNVARALQPSIIVVENVSAFLTRRVRHPVDQLPVSAANYLVEELEDDYVAFPLVADLAEFGVPQTRVRSFITLIRRDLPGLKDLERLGRAPFPRPTHPFDGTGERPIALEQALKAMGLPSLDAKSKSSAVHDGYGGLHAVPIWPERIYNMVAAIPKGTGASAWMNQTCIECGPVDVADHEVDCPVCGSALLRPIKEEDGRRRLIKGFASSYRRMHIDRPAATITTASGHVGSDYTIHPTENRLLSMLECAGLQTFPNDFDWGDSLKTVGATNVREMIGEAVPPHFTRLHGLALRGVLDGSWRVAPISAADDRCHRARQKLSSASKVKAVPELDQPSDFLPTQ